jgi:flagellar capping protein FliD
MKLLTSDEKHIQRYTSYIKITPIKFIKGFLPYRLSLKHLLNFLEINGFETIVTKKSLVITAPRNSLASSLHRILDEIEMKQEQIKKSIQKATDNLKLALESNKILKSMLEISVENEKRLTSLMP